MQYVTIGRTAHLRTFLPLLLAGLLFMTVGEGIALDCDPPAGTLGCGDVVSGDTGNGINDTEDYACGKGPVYTGRELVYELINPLDQDVTVELQNAEAGLEIFLLNTCDESDCLPGGSSVTCQRDLAAGTYFLVVDGVDGAEGAFDLEVTCGGSIDPPSHTFSDWLTCEPDSDGPRPDETYWHFISGLYCGTHCDFAMYVVAPCGVTFHTPLWDVESGHLSVYSLFEGRYIDLTAETGNGGFSPLTDNPTGDRSGVDDAQTDVANGDIRIDWQDSRCPEESLAGFDPRFNEQTMDITFEGSPTLAGVYRMEFYNWGGFVWELFANCTGEAFPGYKIFDNECDALNAYEPCPETAILPTPLVRGSCPDPHLDLVVENQGWTAGSTPLVVLINGGADGRIEFDAGPLVRGQRKAVSIPLTGVPPDSVIEVSFDPDGSPGGTGRVLQCSESGGTLVPCRSPGAAEVFQVEACTTGSCSVGLSGPEVVCQEAAELFAAGNPTGQGPFTYEWDMDGDGSPETAGPSPTLVHAYATAGRYTATLSMMDRAGCGATDRIPVEVEPDEIPPAVSGTLLLSRENGSDIRFVWQDLPADLAGGYEIVAHHQDDLVPPDRSAMDGGRVVDTVPSCPLSGNPGALELNGIETQAGLAFYKVRGLSPCSGSKAGPTGD